MDLRAFPIGIYSVSRFTLCYSVYVCVCMYVCVYVCVCVCGVCMCVCVCVCVCQERVAARVDVEEGDGEEEEDAEDDSTAQDAKELLETLKTDKEENNGTYTVCVQCRVDIHTLSVVYNVMYIIGQNDHSHPYNYRKYYRTL